MSDATDADELFDLGDEYSGEGARALQSGDVPGGQEWFRKAIVAYEAALKAAPERDTLLACNLKLCIGARLFGMGSHEDALAKYEEVISVLSGRPDLLGGEEGRDLHAQARLNRAEHRLGQGATDEALREIEEVLAELPEHPYATILLDRCRPPEE